MHLLLKEIKMELGLELISRNNKVTKFVIIRGHAIHVLLICDITDIAKKLTGTAPL
jgi:hypothetical protein